MLLVTKSDQALTEFRGVSLLPEDGKNFRKCMHWAGKGINCTLKFDFLYLKLQRGFGEEVLSLLTFFFLF